MLSFGAVANVVQFCNKVYRNRNKTIWKELYYKDVGDLDDDDMKFLRRMSMGRIGMCASTKTFKSTPIYDVNECVKRPVYSHVFDSRVEMLGIPQINRPLLDGTCSPHEDKENYQVSLPKQQEMPLGYRGQTCKTFSYKNRNKEEVERIAAEFLAANLRELDILKDCRNALTIVSKDLVAMHLMCKINGIVIETQHIIESLHLNLVYSRTWRMSICINGKKELEPDLYAVNRNGKATSKKYYGFHAELYKLVNGADSIPLNYEVNHKNGDRGDTRSSNLDVVSKSGNQTNRGSTSSKSFAKVPLSSVNWGGDRPNNWIVTNYVDGKADRKYFVIGRDGNNKRAALENAVKFKINFLKNKNSVNGLRDLGVNKDNFQNYTVQQLVGMVIERYDNAVENEIQNE